jgi:NAD(P)-dependent dehydrogenase (short-subunit alcohol dehydrogenase family)
MGKLDNKVAVVSGAAPGQGRSHAVNVAAEGQAGALEGLSGKESRRAIRLSA